MPQKVPSRPDLLRLLPGVLLCLGVTLAADLAQGVEAHLFGRAWVEALVLAILIGTAVRTAWKPGAWWEPGIRFSARTLLETAVCLLGASVSIRAVAAIGPAMLFGIAAVVMLAIAASYTISRAVGLRHQLALLVACGNSICGNSAIAAVAPVVGAEAGDIAASIAFTAVLGVLVVLVLPLLIPVIGLSEAQYGVLAGLTVYAVPQVLAATFPVGALAVQIGTLVKLVRVLMLGPVVVALSFGPRTGGTDPGVPVIRRRAPHRLVPWFILGFLGLAGLHSAGLIPPILLRPTGIATDLFTVISMAALGLGVDVRAVARAGLRVTTAVTFSLLTLGVISLSLIRLLGIA